MKRHYDDPDEAAEDFSKHVYVPGLDEAKLLVKRMDYFQLVRAFDRFPDTSELHYIIAAEKDLRQKPCEGCRL